MSRLRPRANRWIRFKQGHRRALLSRYPCNPTMAICESLGNPGLP